MSDEKKTSKKRKGKDKEKAKEEEKEDIEIVEKDDDAYTPNPKPDLDENKVKMLKVRSEKKKQQPAFKRQEWWRYKRLGDGWRKPKGLHSKMRINRRYRPNNVSIGYRGPRNVRGFHPSGFQEVMVHNSKQLEELAIDPKVNAIRIGGTVGMKKRLVIQEKADEMGIRVLNRKEEK